MFRCSGTRASNVFSCNHLQSHQVISSLSPHLLGLSPLINLLFSAPLSPLSLSPFTHLSLSLLPSVLSHLPLSLSPLKPSLASLSLSSHPSFDFSVLSVPLSLSISYRPSLALIPRPSLDFSPLSPSLAISPLSPTRFLSISLLSIFSFGIFFYSLFFWWFFQVAVQSDWIPDQDCNYKNQDCMPKRAFDYPVFLLFCILANHGITMLVVLWNPLHNSYLLSSCREEHIGRPT